MIDATNTEKARANSIMKRLWRVAHGKSGWHTIDTVPHNIERPYAGDRPSVRIPQPTYLKGNVSANARTGVTRHVIWLFRHAYLQVLAESSDDESDALTDHLTKQRWSAIFVQRRDSYEVNQNNRNENPHLPRLALEVARACLISSHQYTVPPEGVGEQHKVIVAELLEYDRKLTGQQIKEQLFYHDDRELLSLLRGLADVGVINTPLESWHEQTFRIKSDRPQILLWALSDLPWHECMAMSEKQAYMRRIGELR